MKYTIFQYPLPAPEPLEDLNTFLSSHRVVQVKQYMASCESGPLLVFVVETTMAGSAKAVKAASTAPRIDYRKELDATQFELFASLRELRKQIADEEGVPVYTIFTNAQLAEMVEAGCGSMAALGKIPGVGKGRLEKYGLHFLKVLIPASHANESEEAPE